ncbi:TRAP transporter small permease subunit [Limnohabitans sp.]|jgi:TRAP-type C4-dicarboxylate transport system permease small subunit|uniref:TRAP transporter small permease subunit n=1 Tax=Limnohabitans sp. TaxID=1907725 RepID=UPI0037C126B5
MKNSIERWLSLAFGLIFLALSLVVALETIMRKVFNTSLQGADELGGYSLAIGSTLAFSLALLGRTHIRVDVFHEHFPAVMRRFMDTLSSVLMTGFAVLMAVLAWYVLEDSRSYQSVAQTPWATPLAYPQTVWFLALAMFALVGLGMTARALVLWVQGSPTLEREFGPRSTKEEVDEELQDLKARKTEGASS